MNTTFSVSHDEQRLRRVLKFLIRRRLKWARFVGVALVVLGAAALAVESLPVPTSGFFIVTGVLFALLLEPCSVAQSMRAQNLATREGYVMTLEETHVAVNAHSYSRRFSWSILDQVVDTPDAWYPMFGKMQAQAVYKDLLTEEQRAEFAAFLARRRSAQPIA
ncbi:YcxB family protein [Saccharothrix longispora]|uniref:YcxB-like C-terminal domain-containing protein n=1 Tax=Saccharothrix longispora TaxID=33920 RepID=A0ABU1PPT9_9PSEU|nr:YcxB family protein [Saccharothrix longispora]MDR6592682.1 hypothetical protein [Saccharothrix longispora]